MLKINGTKGVMTDTSGPKVMEDITCLVFSSFEEILGMQEEWDSFVESVNGDIYLTFDWCRIWWQHYGRGRRLSIFLFREGGSLVGLMPVFIETVWLGPVWLKMAKFVGSDSTTNMVNPPIKFNYAEDIFKSLLQYLIKEYKCDTVWFGPMSGDCAPVSSLRSACSQISRLAVVMQEKVRSPYTVFILPDSFDEYLTSLSSQWRANYRRYMNLLLKKFTVNIEAVQNEKDVAKEYEYFREMHDLQWQSEGKLGHFNDWPRGVEFNRDQLRVQAKLNRAKLIRLTADSEAVSYFLCYVFGNTLHARLSARAFGTEWNKYSLGRVGLIKMIEWAIGQGIQRIEAGAGHYDYKIKLGGKEYPLYTIMLVRKQWFPRLRAYIFANLSSLLHFCYYRIWFNRLVPKLPFKRRPLWKLWIRTRL
jgi:CelD/BcsL family acetyltransferase involved in cellulose biosynthesis